MSPQRASAILLATFVLLGAGPASIAARQDHRFSVPSPAGLVLPAFTDREVAELVTALDAALERPQTSLSIGDADHTLWSFARRLQAGRLTPSQESSVLAHLVSLGRAHAHYRDPIERCSYMVRALTVGKTAPETTGSDLDGAAFRLSDYRGKVVVLTFSAEWCGICRSQYPYYRLMQELYVNWPFAILGVETATRESAIRLKTQHGLTYRSWWDGLKGETGPGPIASAWNVLGWPTTYVLDAEGVIRFVDLRDEDLLKGVRQLLVEQVSRADVAPPPQRQ